MIAVRDRLEEFGDTTIAVVTFTPVERLAAYSEALRLPFDIVSDTERQLYGDLGIGRGTRRQVWSLGTILMYVKLLRSGRRLQRSDEDLAQLGADVIVDRDGRIVKVFRPATPDARPGIDELLAAMPNLS